MRIKIIFNGCNKSFNDSIIEKVNGFVNYCLGENNEYHGKFSNYAVSSLQGGKMDKNGVLTFKDGAYLYVSSLNMNFISMFMTKLLSSNKGVDEMTVKSFEIERIVPHNEYDIIRTISPILLTVSKDRKKRIVTIKDNDFFDVLTEQSKKKLIKEGFSESKVNTLTIEPFHIENAKTKCVIIKGIPNIASKIMAVVKGEPEIREALYDMGLGKSTGYCFGSVTINS